MLSEENRLSLNEDSDEEQISSNDKSDAEASEDNEMSETEINKSGNHGWADAMSKILHSNKPKRKKTLVLSKAKKLCDVVKKPKEEPLPFEIEEDGRIKREVIKQEEADSEDAPKQIRKRKDVLKNRTKPNILDRERERTLQKIATKGVVTLFNAVKKQQGEIETKLIESGPLERKREKVLQNVDKNSFLDVLMGGTKSIQVESSTPDVKKDEDKEQTGVWKVLRDDFGMNASMKNWDKEDESSESDNDNNETNVDEDEESEQST